MAAVDALNRVVEKQFVSIPAQIIHKASKIKLLICDVDGVLSDGKVYYTSATEELKNFNIKDGLGIKLLQKAGIEVAIITGRDSPIVAHRAKDLGIELVFQGHKNKISALEQIAAQRGLTLEQIAHIGDDLPDLAIFNRVGLGVAVADGHFYLLEKADWISSIEGGQGAVRQVADLLLFAQGKLTQILQEFDC